MIQSETKNGRAGKESGNFPAKEPQNTTPLQKKAMISATVCQCFGSHGLVAFRNGIVLLYLLALGFGNGRVIAALSYMGIFLGLIMVPAAYFSDRIGKKRFGYVGHVMGILGFVLIGLAGFLKGTALCGFTVISGILIYALGAGVLASSWFALLKPIVPERIRGRFFGWMKISWQTATLLFSAVAAFVLKYNDSLMVFQIFIFLIALMLIVRIMSYYRIPEVEKVSDKNRAKFFSVMGSILRINGYASFAAYIFLLNFFTFFCPGIFSMVEKEFLKLNPNTVVWLSNIYLIGAMAGFGFVGIIVDKYGTKVIFIICHFSYAFLLFSFVFRGLAGPFMVPVLGIIHFFYGIMFAASGIAMAKELFSLIPKRNQSMAAAFIHSMPHLAFGFSGYSSFLVLDIGFLRKNWTLWGLQLCDFDSLLLIAAAMVLLLVITLGLVPSIIKPDKGYTARSIH
jgi:MFS family permease